MTLDVWVNGDIRFNQNTIAYNGKNGFARIKRKVQLLQHGGLMVYIFKRKPNDITCTVNPHSRFYLLNKCSLLAKFEQLFTLNS